MDRIEPRRYNYVTDNYPTPDWETPDHEARFCDCHHRGGSQLVTRPLLHANSASACGWPCGDRDRRVKRWTKRDRLCATRYMDFVYAGELTNSNIIILKVRQHATSYAVKIMMNVGNPNRAFDFAMLPNAGYWPWLRLEFIINRMIGIPTRKHYWTTTPSDMPPLYKKKIDHRNAGLQQPHVEFYVDKLVEGVATLACSFSKQTSESWRFVCFKVKRIHNLSASRCLNPDERKSNAGSVVQRVNIDASFPRLLRFRHAKAIRRVRNVWDWPT